MNIESYELTMIILGLFVVILVISFLIAIVSSSNNQNQRITLNDQINQLKLEKEKQIEHIQSLSNINKRYNMQTIVSNVLDDYDQSNIKLPADIYEDLSITPFTSEADVYTFIEQRRQVWKHETMKKPIKRKY